MYSTTASGPCSDSSNTISIAGLLKNESYSDLFDLQTLGDIKRLNVRDDIPGDLHNFLEAACIQSIFQT